MEKNLGKIKTLVIILISILLCLIAFWGLYFNNNGIWKNILPDYKYGLELSGYRELHFILDETENEKEIYVDENGNYMGDVKEDSTDSDSDASLLTTDEENIDTDVVEEAEENVNEEAVEEKTENDIAYDKITKNVKINPDEMRTIDNFEKTKKIIQKRFDKISLNEYNIRQNIVTGEIVIEVADDDNLSLKQGLIVNPGKITILDYQNGLILLDDSHIKQAILQSANTEEGYQLYLQILFDKYGAEKIKEISNKYRTVVDDNGEEETTYVSVNLDNSTIVSTYFGEEISSGVLQIPYGQAYSNYEEFVEFVKSSAFLGGILNGEKLPLKYNLSSDNYINTSLDKNIIIFAVGLFGVVILVVSIIMIIKYKSKSIKYIALSLIYISVLSIICRYTNVFITYNSLIAYICVIVLNYCLYFKLLNKLKTIDNLNIAFKTTIKEYYLSIIPVIIIAVIFTFMYNVSISSIGMLLFWGLLLQFLVSLLAL